MRNLKLKILPILASVLAIPFPVEAQVKVSQSVFGSGSTKTASQNNQVVGTVGQALIGQSSSTTNIINVGFWYQSVSLITSVEQIESDILPEEFRLEQNYPNPFNPTTTIRFALPQKSKVTLRLFDIIGREVVTLVDDELPTGEYKLVLEAGNLSSGVYFYRLETPDFVMTRKLTLLK